MSICSPTQDVDLFQQLAIDFGFNLMPLKNLEDSQHAWANMMESTRQNRWENDSERFFRKMVGKAPRGSWARLQHEHNHFIRNDYTDRNAGIITGATSGIIVLDVDDPARFALLAESNGWEIPSTLRVNTGEGYHLYFRMPEGVTITNAGSVTEVFDIRGQGGYACAPGSVHYVTGRRYEMVDQNAEIALLPQWIIERSMAAQAEKQAPACAEPILPPEEDLDIDSLRLSRQIKDLIRAYGLDDRSAAIGKVIYAMAYAGYDLGEIENVILQGGDIARKFSGWSAETREAELRGNKARADRDRLTRQASCCEMCSEQGTRQEINIRPVGWLSLQAMKFPPEEWLIKGLIPARELTFIVADGGVGKGLLMLALCHNISTGSDMMGGNVFTPAKQGRCLYLSKEDQSGIIQQRIRTLMPPHRPDFDQMMRRQRCELVRQYGLDQDACQWFLPGQAGETYSRFLDAYQADNLGEIPIFADMDSRFQIIGAERMEEPLLEASKDTLVETGLFKLLMEIVSTKEFDVIFLDTLNTICPAASKDEVLAACFINKMNKLMRTGNCAVVVSTHNTKAASSEAHKRGKINAVLHSSAQRGSSALYQGARAQLSMGEFTRVPEGVDTSRDTAEHTTYIAMAMTKGNFAEKYRGTITLRRHTDPENNRYEFGVALDTSSPAFLAQQQLEQVVIQAVRDRRYQDTEINCLSRNQVAEALKIRGTRPKALVREVIDRLVASRVLGERAPETNRPGNHPLELFVVGDTTPAVHHAH